MLWKDTDKSYTYPVSILSEGGIYELTENRMSGWDFTNVWKITDGNLPTLKWAK